MISIRKRNPELNTRINSKVKFILVILVALLLTFVIELAFNIPSITSGYTERSLGQYVKKSTNTLVCDADFGKEIFIKKLRLRGDFPVNVSYTVEIYNRNDFGIEQKEILADWIYVDFDSAFTSINKKAERIVITINGLMSDGANDLEVVISNQLEINKYRCILIALCVLIIEILIAYKQLITTKLEYFFVIFALGFGIIIILMIGPRSVTWDEQIHYGNVYLLASDDIVEWNEAAWSNHQNSLPDINTKEELYMLKQLLNEKGEIYSHSKDNNASYTQVAMRGYTPMVWAYWLGDKLGFSYVLVHTFGRISNLFIYVLAVFCALRVTKERKILIFSFSVLPTVLFQGSTYTYDGVVYALMLLGFVLLINEFQEKQSVNILQLMGAILLISIGSFSKAVYIPILLLILALPNSKFIDKKHAYIFKIGICIIFLMIMSTFVLPVLSNTVSGNLEYGDARGGDTSVVRQIMSMIHHPFSTIKLFVTSILSFDNFRNLGYAAADNYLFTNLMFLNFASFGTLADKWSLLLIPLLVLLFFVPQERVSTWPLAAKVWLILVIIATVLLVWMALYLSFTPVGSAYIDGVQARYYFPLLLPATILTCTGKFSGNVSVRTYNTMIISINGILMFECIYQLLLTCKCL